MSLLAKKRPIIQTDKSVNESLETNDTVNENVEPEVQEQTTSETEPQQEDEDDFDIDFGDDPVDVEVADEPLDQEPVEADESLDQEPVEADEFIEDDLVLDDTLPTTTQNQTEVNVDEAFESNEVDPIELSNDLVDSDETLEESEDTYQEPIDSQDDYSEQESYNESYDEQETYDESDSSNYEEEESETVNYNNSESEQSDSGNNQGNQEISNQTSEQSNGNSIKREYVLYIVTDKQADGLLSYFRYYGLKVSKVFNNIKDASEAVVMSMTPCKVVVMETGRGKFTSVSNRKSLMEVLSLGAETSNGDDDYNNEVEIFYTDSIVKAEAKNSVEFDYRKLKWHNYSTTAVVLATLLQELKEETYVYEYEDKEEIDKSNKVLEFKGVPAKTGERMDIGLPALRLFEIIDHEGDNITDDESLPGYKIRV